MTGMDDWRKDNVPRPQARLPLDAEDWSWREDRAPGERASDRDDRAVARPPGSPDRD